MQESNQEDRIHFRVNSFLPNACEANNNELDFTKNVTDLYYIE
jgi:hypothetical protein